MKSCEKNHTKSSKKIYKIRCSRKSKKEGIKEAAEEGVREESEEGVQGEAGERVRKKE
ncbi:hypothetical protein ACVW0P_003706 [Mucilaginibacter sp. UYNi724]